MNETQLAKQLKLELDNAKQNTINDVALQRFFDNEPYLNKCDLNTLKTECNKLGFSFDYANEMPFGKRTFNREWNKGKCIIIYYLNSLN